MRVCPISFISNVSEAGPGQPGGWTRVWFKTFLLCHIYFHEAAVSFSLAW